MKHFLICRFSLPTRVTGLASFLFYYSPATTSPLLSTPPSISGGFQPLPIVAVRGFLTLLNHLPGERIGSLLRLLLWSSLPELLQRPPPLFSLLSRRATAPGQRPGGHHLTPAVRGTEAAAAPQPLPRPPPRTVSGQCPAAPLGCCDPQPGPEGSVCSDALNVGVEDSGCESGCP